MLRLSCKADGYLGSGSSRKGSRKLSPRCRPPNTKQIDSTVVTLLTDILNLPVRILEECTLLQSRSCGASSIL
jgi:hypothetical protein